MILGNILTDGHSNNSLFAEVDPVHRHNPTEVPRLLRQALLAQGIEINTPDLNAGRQVLFDIHLEARPLTRSTSPVYLMALENPNINRLNESREHCAQFNLVFAWDARLHDMPNVVPIMYPYAFNHHDFPGFAERDIFASLINANKAFKHPMPTDLYVERLKVIRWYEKNAPDQFALYGLGWDKPTPAFTGWGRLKRGVGKLLDEWQGKPAFPSYRGEVVQKSEVLLRSRFSYCYENNRDLSNYITEKIFDSLVCGCVPVYWGADNILEHIPADCLIDRRSFKTTADVHARLAEMDSNEFESRQAAIRTFLQGEAVRRFDARTFAATIADRVKKDLMKARIGL